MGSDDDDDAWFAPKRYGLGAGLPIRWQGWAVLAAALAVVLIGAPFFATRPIVAIAILVPMTVALLVITAKKTRGGWRWRWGNDD